MSKNFYLKDGLDALVTFKSLELMGDVDYQANSNLVCFNALDNLGAPLDKFSLHHAFIFLEKVFVNKMDSDG